MKLPFIDRSFWSYSKVQFAWGDWLRNNRRQLQTRRVRSLQYLNVGCGSKPFPQFINLDFLWHPKIDICWDITRGLPFANESLTGIFSEHCLEIFSLPQVLSSLQEFRRVLKPGGTARIVLPDGGLFLQIYHEQMSGNTSVRFPLQEIDSFAGIYTPILSVNRFYYQDHDSLFGHRSTFDVTLLCELLKKAGFAETQPASFQKGRDATLLIDSPDRACESLYVEAW